MVFDKFSKAIHIRYSIFGLIVLFLTTLHQAHLSTDDLDDLDKEITEIVEAATCRVPIHVEAAEDTCPHVTGNSIDTCHRPQPIRTAPLSPRDSPDQV